MTWVSNAHQYSKWKPLALEALAAAVMADDDPSSHKIDMSDPKQQGDGFDVGTPMDQLRLAIQTIETELQTPDGSAINEEDIEEAQRALQVLRSIVDRIETKGAGYMAEHREKPRSDR